MISLKNILFLNLLVIGITSIAQTHNEKIDSLTKRVESGVHKKSEAKDHSQLALIYNDIGNMAEAFKHIDISIKLAKDIKDYNQIGESLGYKKDICQSFYLSETIRDKKLLLIIKEAISIFDSISDHKVRSRVWSFKADRIEIQHKDLRSNDSLQILELGYRDKSLKELERYAKENAEDNINYGIDARRIELSQAFIDHSQFDIALKYAKEILQPKVYDDANKEMRPLNIMLAHCIMSIIYIEQNMPQKTMIALETSISYANNIASDKDVYRQYKDWVYSIACWAYLEMKEYELAYTAMLKRYEVRALDFDEEKLLEMGKAEANLKMITDSISSFQHVQIQQIEIESKSTQNKWLLIILGIVSILLFLVFSFLRKMRASKQIIEQKNKEVNVANENYEMLLIESNHRIKNNLQMILSMLEYKAIKSGKRTEELEKITGNIKAISSLHKHLSLDVHNPYVDLIVYLKEIVSLYKEFSPQNFEVKSDLKAINIQSERIVYFGLLFNEMLSNTIEHSLDKDTKMVISLNKEKHGYSFSYRDGAEWDNKKNTGLGSSLIPELVERVEGDNYNLDSTQGLYYFEFNT